MPSSNKPATRASGSPRRLGGERLHRHVADALRRRIIAGSVPQGGKLPTLRELAAEFNVSTMTVRQALHRLEQDGHVYHIPSVGAFAKPPAQAKTQTRRMVALAATDLCSAFEMGIARGVEHACQERGWAVQIIDAQHDPQVEARNMLGLSESGASGAIIIPTWGDARCIETLSRVLKRNFPVVIADRIPPGITADFVESDHENGGFLATKHLLERGHRQVLMLTPPPQVSSVAARLQGYQRALLSFGQTPRPEWMVWLNMEKQADALRAHRKWHAGYEAMLPVLKASKPPLAVFAVDPYTAWGVYEACRELGLRIPDDVSIVGFDDSEITMAMRPAITIIRQRTDEIGRAAVDLLGQVFTGRPRNIGHARGYTHTVIDVELIERQSVATAR